MKQFFLILKRNLEFETEQSTDLYILHRFSNLKQDT